MNNTLLGDLTNTLSVIEENDQNYDLRESLVYLALALAKRLGYEAGIRIDPSDEGEKWPVVCIVLPDVGEVSWHCPAYGKPFTDYDTIEKYRRVRAFVTKK